MSSPPHLSSPAARPTPVTVVAIFNIVLGICCGLSSLWTAATPLFIGMQQEMMESTMAATEAQIEQERQQRIADLERQKKETNDPNEKRRLQDEIDAADAEVIPDMGSMFGIYDPFTKGSGRVFFPVYGIFGGLINILLLISGVGMFGMSGWSRKLAIIAAIGIIVHAVAYAAFSMFVLGPAMGESMQGMMDEIAQSAPPAPGQPGMPNMSAMMSMWTGFGAVFYLIIMCLWPVIMLFLLNSKTVKAAFDPSRPSDAFA